MEASIVQNETTTRIDTSINGVPYSSYYFPIIASEVCEIANVFLTINRL